MTTIERDASSGRRVRTGLPAAASSTGVHAVVSGDGSLVREISSCLGSFVGFPLRSGSDPGFFDERGLSFWRVVLS